MSILSSLYTGISGLAASGQAMGIVSDNIANSATTGFKASRGEFADVVSANLKGILGGNQIGQGTKLAGVTSLFTQGGLTTSERDADMAIRGDGFFVLRNQNGVGEVSYTRDGSFRFDAKGRLTTAEGQLVQGYKVNQDTGKAAADLGDVAFTGNTIPAKGTAEVKIDTNLDNRKPINTSKFELATADKTADLTSAVRIYDSAGTAQTLNMYFYKTGESQWNWYGTADGATLQGGKDGENQVVAEGKLTFTKDGKLSTDELTSSNLKFRGAEDNAKVDFNFGDAIISRKGTGLQGSNPVRF